MAGIPPRCQAEPARYVWTADRPCCGMPRGRAPVGDAATHRGACPRAVPHPLPGRGPHPALHGWPGLPRRGRRPPPRWCGARQQALVPGVPHPRPARRPTSAAGHERGRRHVVPAREVPTLERRLGLRVPVSSRSPAGRRSTASRTAVTHGKDRLRASAGSMPRWASPTRPGPGQVRFLVKNSSSLSNGMRSLRSYRSTWSASGTITSSTLSGASACTSSE